MELSREHRSALEEILQTTDSDDERHRNAYLLLEYARGGETHEIASNVGLSESRTRFFRRLFERVGMEMFEDGFSPRKLRSDKAQTTASVQPLLTAQELETLRDLLEQDLPDDLRTRITIIVSYAEGRDTRSIAEDVGLSASRTRYWRKAFEREGMTMFSMHGVTSPASSIHPDQDRAPVSVLQDASGSDAEQAVPDMDAESDEPKRTSRAATAAKKKSPGLQISDSFTEAGRKVLRLHFNEMLEQGQSSDLGSDPEVVHRMRVATRRMRSAFEVFHDAFTDKTRKKYRKPLRNTGRALGAVRDLDVLMMHMHEYAVALPDEQAAAFQPLINEWEKERGRNFEALLAYLHSEEYNSFCEEFGDFIDTEGKGGTEEPFVIEGVPKRIGEIAPVLIMERYTDVLAFGAELETATLDRLHMLRIQFKKLRYTMEYFTDLLGPHARKTIRQVTDVQDYLGLLQDDQTAGEIVTAFIQELDLRQTTLPLGQRLNSAPLLTYLAERQSRKHSLLTSFGEIWAQFTSKDFRKRFLRVLLQA
ncbi:MAG: hypothetical protein C0600_06730 [Ignavibacteria bacterium]|nr:MAG: hypothetical protein C0600_06730 [Ignavibacteria bacterium]